MAVVLRGNRLGVHPGTAYAALPEADRAALRTYRAELKALLRHGYTPADIEQPATAPPPEAEPPQADTIGREDYDALGLFELRGVLTHAFGDEFARRIVRGEISRDYAMAITAQQRRDYADLGADRPRRVRVTTDGSITNG